MYLAVITMYYKARLTIRLDKNLMQKVEQICIKRREGKSSFIRRAILFELGRLSFLTLEEKQAIGLDVNTRNLSHDEK